MRERERERERERSCAEISHFFSGFDRDLMRETHAWITAANFMRLRKLRVANAVSISHRGPSYSFFFSSFFLLFLSLFFFDGGTWIKSLRYLQSSRKLRDAPRREIAASSFSPTPALSTLFTYRYEGHWAGWKVLPFLWLDPFNIDKICLLRIIIESASLCKFTRVVYRVVFLNTAMFNDNS